MYHTITNDSFFGLVLYSIIYIFIEHDIATSFYKMILDTYTSMSIFNILGIQILTLRYMNLHVGTVYHNFDVIIAIKVRLYAVLRYFNFHVYLMINKIIM